ncbi:serpin family protein [Clostridium kluyveri]|uniref:Protease n=1 Tax=Clostridium kluyveri TaxID=1534 RepID=A0A1L5F835_CLOKL|nr:serpin family protein [Clostridium kluyveri]APM39178.1 protease [Clostridium kluyveri]UZQ51506.1 serpin family protein [Clostridium kluyveri]
MLNKSKREKIVPLFLLMLFMTTYTHFTPVVHADSDEKSQITQFEAKKNISTMKTWTIKFRTPVDENSLFINVADSQGNFMNVKIFTDSSGKYVYVDPPEEGYKLGQTYYLNISKDIVFKDPGRSLKNDIQMKFTTNDIGTINIDETTSIITANNTFAFNLMKNLISEDNTENIIISPLSISSILAMTQNGAAGETKQEMLNCIGLKNISDSDINKQYYSLLDYYNNLKSTDLKMVNSIWTNKQITLNSDFKNTAEKYYDSQVSSEDFEDADTLVKINKWVNDHTGGQIQKILDSIDKDTGAILINSLYFKGTWEDQFSTSNTKKEDFTLSNGNKLNIDTMQNTSYVNYLEGPNFQAISLPYYDNMEMDIFLPNEGVNINDFTQSITKEKFDTWINNFKSTYVLQQIPKFKMYYDVDLNDTLKALGMDKAFNSREANFTKLTTSTITSQEYLYINKIKHKAYISVNEQGTEAAAVTAVIMNPTSARPGNPIYFKANRPFFFIIRDTKTGGISFMGKMDNPNASDTEPTN